MDRKIIAVCLTVTMCGLFVGCTGESSDKNQNQESSDGGKGTGTHTFGDGGVALKCDVNSCKGFCQSKGKSEGTCNGTQCVCAASITTCAIGTTVPCYSGPIATANVGICKSGVSTCKAAILPDSGYEFDPGRWSSCEGEHLPSSDMCNGMDDDCDGVTDNGPSGCAISHQECNASSDCKPGLVCVDYPVTGDKVCDRACTQTCPGGYTCLGNEDGSGYCYYSPQTTCWSHEWRAETFDGMSHHSDSCMNCTGKPELATGTRCVPSNLGSDLSVLCEPTTAPSTRRWEQSVGTRTLDFVAVDFPLQNPFEMNRCLVAWGVHKMTQVDATPRATFKIPGAAGHMEPLEVEGFRTYLPAAALPHYIVERPPLPKTLFPTKREERAVRAIWEEPSVLGNFKNTNMPYPYQDCPACKTYGEVIDFLYPGGQSDSGPRIFCQGLGDRDGVADSQFVIPFYLPNYDGSLGKNIVIVTEIICELPQGILDRSVTAWPISGEWPAKL